MFAVIQTGGKQYKVAQGDILRVEKLAGNVGDAITFDHVLLTADDKGVRVGAPYVSGAKVTAKIFREGRGKKLIVYKFRRRKNYRRKAGHRQPFTELQITGVTG